MKRAVDPGVRFRAEWRVGGCAEIPEADSLESFLVDRYCLFAQAGGRMLTTRVHHPPWRLARVKLEQFGSTLLAANGLPEPIASPLVHHTPGVKVDVWAPSGWQGYYSIFSPPRIQNDQRLLWMLWEFSLRLGLI